jgi:hypothetical protein
MAKKTNKISKEQNLINEWKAYNKRSKSSNISMSFEEYKSWVLNVSTSRKKSISKITKEPHLAKPSWASNTDHIQSVNFSNHTHQPTRNTMMEKVRMGFETGEAAAEIINKSKRIGLMYSKGTYGYITDGTDVKDLGKKNPTI